jgi:outer membrane lipoprotein-sorting protein
MSMRKVFIIAFFWLTSIAVSAQEYRLQKKFSSGAAAARALGGTDSVSTAITKFEMTGQVGATVIDTLTGDIFLTMPEGTNVKTLTPVIETKGKSVTLLWNKGNDAQCPHVYASLAHNGNAKEYCVYYTFLDKPKSSECSIRSFKIGSSNGVILGDTIRVRNLSAETNLSAIAPEILISDKASIAPNSGVAQDFRSPVAYAVTAENGVSQKRYTAIVAKKDDAPTAIEKTFSKELIAYPNPFTHDIYIETVDDVAQADVFDSWGALRLSKKNVLSKKINFDKLPDGVYFVRVTLSSGASKVIQVIKR